MKGSHGSTLKQRLLAWRWLLPLLAITLPIGTLSLWAYRVFSAQIRDEAARTLAGITEEKRSTIEHWLADADTDARTFFTRTSVTMLMLEEWIAGGRREQAVLDRLRARLEEVARERDWGGLTLYDDQGEPLVVIGDGGAPVPAERVQDILHRPRLERLDAQPGTDGVWRYGLLAPVGAEDGPPLGVAALTWNLEQALFPVLATWPIPSNSASSALIRREGDTVRFLVTKGGDLIGEQRSFSDTPRLFAVQAAQGQRGIINGALDYRGMPVLGYAVPIAGTPWTLLAKIDREEAEAGLRGLAVTLTLATLLVLSLVYGVGFGLWRWDRQRRDTIALEREQALRRQEQQTRRLLDAIITSSADAIFAKDLEGRYLLANRACAEGLGLTVEQLLGRRDGELLPPAFAAMLGEVESRVLAGETFVNLEQRLVLPGGERTYLTTKAPLHDAEGGIIGLFGIARDVSERERQEAALRAAEATAARLQEELRWKEALDAAGHGVWDWDIRGGQAEFSPTIPRLLGLEPADLGTDPDAWLQRLHPDDRVRIEPQLSAALASDPGRFEVRHRSRQRDGGWRWFLSRGLVTERGPDGAPWRMIGTLTDITTWQEAEERLRESEKRRRRSEERLTLVTEGADLGTWYFDLATHTMEWSERCKRQHLIAAEETPTLERFYAALHPDDRSRVEVKMQAAMTGQDDYVAEYLVPQPDGTVRWLSAPGRIYRDADGTAVAMGGVTLDITARKEAELALSEHRDRLQTAIAGLEAEIAERRKVEAELVRSEERVRRQWIELEAIYTTAPVGLFVLDRDLRFLRLNERLAEMNGLPVAAHLGRRVREIVPDLADVAEPLFQGVIERDEPLLNVQLSGETAAQPGIRRHWREHFYPMKDTAGQVVGINGVVEEITEIKRIEEEIRALNTDLEAKVEARTAESRAASAAKSEFLAHMSHEIRTPLNAVLGLVQVMEQSALTPAQRDLIARVRAAGRSLLLLLNDILDFSKIEAGQLQLEARPFVLPPLLEQLDSLLGATARAKGLRFAIEVAPLPGALVGDPLRLEQVLTNLIGNAIKFTPRGEVRLSARALETDDSTARLRFAVTDTGIGIAPEVLPQLFAAFTQADSGISRRFGGSGLGLAISKRLVELMGGVIGVESREGAGSTFWFELSCPRTAADPEMSATPRSAGTGTTGPRLTGRQYLIVDDNVLNLDVLERMLALEGARATRAGDGRQALARLRTHADDFDAVLMDVQMPGLDGLSATRVIRGELGLTRLPVIAVTAGVLKEEQQRAREAGVDDVLPKPVELDHLVAVLSRWPSRAAAGPDAAQAVAPVAPDAAPAAVALPAIVGIDQAHVARLTRGDVAFYRRLLSGLVAEAHGVPELVRADLARGADQEAAAHLHRLRGVAANVGALELAAVLRQLEEALVEDRSAIAARLAEVEAHLARLLTAAAEWLAQTQPIVAPPTEETADIAERLDPVKLAALREALAANRPRPARQLFAELRAGLSGHYGPALTRAISTHLAALALPAALSALDEAMSDTAASQGILTPDPEKSI